MKREQEIFRHISILSLVGISLISLTCFIPNAGQDGTGCFFRIATAHVWGGQFDLACAWCSVKIILFSLGLFLVIESLGSILAVANQHVFAWLVYLLHVAPCFGVLLGGYCLAKALI